ncbi:pupal cuticle protein 20-like [Aethina tumida]|uniref:pupal cuticle protein 20-like n=1 Tax=Aethina tumida TaxID=116153 RepID=UPI002147884E|nr:pupal cuticle protein 20-like [Aethina tumida]
MKFLLNGFLQVLAAFVACASAARVDLNDGRYYPDNSGAYNNNDGRYYPDNSGAYVPDGSGAYVHDDAGYRHQDDKYRHQADRFGGNGGNGGAFGGNGGFGAGSGAGHFRPAGAGAGAGAALGGAANAGRYGNANGFYDNRNYAIIRKVEDVHPDGYHYLYETENGILAEEQGKLERAGSKDEAINAGGFFTYTGPDNVVYRVDYTANEDGFVPVAEHIPTPPPIPAAIVRSLEYQRAAGKL